VLQTLDAGFVTASRPPSSPVGQRKLGIITMLRHQCTIAWLLTVIAGLAPAAEPAGQDIVFKAACDGTEQRYVLVLPKDFQPAQTHDVLVALHGHGSDRWQFVRDPRDECRAARDVAAKHGLLFVSPDYRARTSWMGPKAEADVVQIIGELKRQYGSPRVRLRRLDGRHRSAGLRCAASGVGRGRGGP